MKIMSNAGFCDVCHKSANQKCGGCHELFYCSREHQKFGWKSHKKTCKPCKTLEDPQLGRYLVSTKPIKIGEIIFKESPLIYGPSQMTVPVCLGCMTAINEENNKPCPDCGWPMCSELCQKNPSHLPECRYTVQRGDKVTIRNFGMVHPIYQCVTVLRCLYQKQFLPEIWNKLNELESHCEKRKNTQKYKSEKVQVAEFIRRFFKLDQIFTEEDIMRVCGIIMVNSHEVPLAEPPYIALYETCSIMEHNCKANCSKSFGNDGSLVLVAGEDIYRGSNLSICYTDPLWGTPNRRHHLFETKFFWCTCSRCSDPTEFGTYFSAMKCQNRSCDGYLLPKTFLEKTDNTKNSDWRCNKCKQSMSCFSVQDIVDKLGSDMTEVAKDDLISLKNFVKTLSSYVHTNHFYSTEVKLAMAQLLGIENGRNALENICREDLELKAVTASQLSSLFAVIAPAERRLRGTTIFELHAAVAEMGRRSGRKEGKTDVMHMRIMEAKQYLIDCIELLKHEPSSLPEGLILKQAQQNLKNIDIILRKIHQSNSSL